MNKYLIEILKIKNSVILPGLGGFMIANSKTGKIIINKHLKFDDGILAGFIAEKEGIDKTEAKNMVSKFVREIEAVLGKGETYDIYQFGKITKGEKGDLIFDMDKSLIKEPTTPITSIPKVESKKEEVKKSENTIVPPVVEKKSEIKKDEKSKKDEVKNTYVPPVVKEKTSTKDKVTEAKKSSKEDLAKVKKDAKALEVKKKEEAKVLAAKKKKEAKDLVANKKAEAKEKAALLKKQKAEAKKKGKTVVILDEKGKPKKKKSKLVPIIIILLLLGGLGTGGYLYQDKIKEMLGMNTVAEHSEDETAEEHEEHHENDEDKEEHLSVDDETSNNLESDSLIDQNNDGENVEEETITEEVVEEQVQEEVKVNVSTSVNGSYHIIGGGFGEESNATKYAEKNNGTVLGRFDNLYLVALKSYDSRADAQADLSNLKSVSSGAWIFKYSK